MSFVENPIINSPFEEPKQFYDKKGRKFSLTEGRRPSGYWYKKKVQKEFVDEFKEIELVNSLRQEIKEWREKGYPNTTQITRDLLLYWTRKDRERKLFYCQIELIETIIWLVEVASKETLEKVPLDRPLNIDPNKIYESFIRYCGKMATGTGKTIVMGCLIAWQVINSLYHVTDERFTSNILLVAPNRTVRQRDLEALNPTSERNYYIEFDLVPNDLLALLLQGNYFITNWHFFLLKDDTGVKGVLKRGRESDIAFVKRFISQGYSRFDHNKKIFVLNDEAHHAYRPSLKAFNDLKNKQQNKISTKILEFETIIKAKDQGEEFIENLKKSKVKKDQDLAKKIEKLSRSEELMIRKQIQDYYILLEFEEIISTHRKGKRHLRQLKNSFNENDKNLVKKVESLKTKDIININSQIDKFYENFSSILKLNEDLLEATAWIGGLDRINDIIGINFCIDLSATPFYNKNSGYAEGTPFPWVISDFCLADAIESAITKIPRYPLKDNAPETIARYYRLWEWITKQIKSKNPKSRALKPEDIYKHAQDALDTLASQWKRSKRIFEENSYGVPPLMILVCDKTNTSKVFYEAISQGNSIDEFKNSIEDEKIFTYQIDSSILKKAEAIVGDVDPNLSKEEIFRELVANIGKINTNGQDIRCVISVGMLSEGWDAHNVTQILGLRAFKSSLLCEQVVGRGLRRMNYDDFTVEEYVDVYGIPFDTLPTKGETATFVRRPKPTILVKAESKRRNYEIRFPRVEGYNISISEKIKLDRSKCVPIYLKPETAPTKIITAPYTGVTSEEEGEIQDRTEAYKRMQLIKFQIANEVLNYKKKLKTDQKSYQTRLNLFPQLYKITDDFVKEFVIEQDEAPINEVYLLKYRDKIIKQLNNSIISDEDDNNPKILPKIERFRKFGTSARVSFRTSKVKQSILTKKSHINYVICPNIAIKSPIEVFENSKYVYSYVRNDHLDFSIPNIYDQTNYDKKISYFYPEYIFTLLIYDKDTNQNESHEESLKRILWTEEQKNFRIIYVIYSYSSGLDEFLEIENSKETAIKQWVEAVNNLGGLGSDHGHWTYIIKGKNEDLNNLIEIKKSEILKEIQNKLVNQDE